MQTYFGKDVFSMKKVTIYTDGACSGNPGPGGWGAILIYNDNKKEISGGAKDTTNNIMELTGFPWGKIYNIHLFENIKFPKGYWFKDTINHMIIYPICRSYKHISDNVYYYRVNSEGASALAKHQIKSLDAFYILQRLMKDMQKLQIENDEYFQKYILKAIRLCYQRTRHLNGEVKKSVFTCVRDMYIHQIYNEHYKFVGKDRVLVNALLKNNYLLYKLNCFLML